MAWQDKLRKVDPYIAGEQPKMEHMIKLNTNENPYGPSKKVEAILKNYDSDMLRLYPSSDASDLRKELAHYYQLDESQIFLGNGSDEVLALSFLTFFNGKDPILFPDITYSFYPVYCKLFQMTYKEIPVLDDFTICFDDYKQKNSGIIFPNPNAPTGLLLSVDQIEALLKENRDSVVIVDEAYIDFGGTSAVPLINKYDNLVVIQTFSKSRSLAGMRVGLALGRKESISKLQDVKNSFNSYPLDRLAQLVAIASIQDQSYFDQTRKKIMDTRQWTKKELQTLGFKVLDSYANFIFVTHPSLDAKVLFQNLRKEGIIVRHFNQERIDQYLRIAIGTRKEMEALIMFLKQEINHN